MPKMPAPDSSPNPTDANARPNCGYPEAVDKIKTALSTSSFIPANKQDWLRHLHKEYHSRFLSDNQRIWMSAQIFIPASMVPMVALASFKQKPPLPLVICFGLVSIWLVLFWHVIAVVHKSYQNKNLAWMEAIESVAGLSVTGLPERVFSESEGRFLRKGDVLPKFRSRALIITILLWTSLIVVHIFFWPSSTEGLSSGNTGMGGSEARVPRAIAASRESAGTEGEAGDLVNLRLRLPEALVVPGR